MRRATTACAATSSASLPNYFTTLIEGHHATLSRYIYGNKREQTPTKAHLGGPMGFAQSHSFTHTRTQPWAHLAGPRRPFENGHFLVLPSWCCARPVFWRGVALARAA
eukprot:scaffold64890_cov104-Phaeocystis_antarctica.AAC.2